MNELQHVDWLVAQAKSGLAQMLSGCCWRPGLGARFLPPHCGYFHEAGCLRCFRGSIAWKGVEFRSSFPYHILLAGEGEEVLGQRQMGRGGLCQGRSDSLRRAVPRGGAIRGRSQRRERKQHFLQAILRTVSDLCTSYFDTWSDKEHEPGPASDGAVLSALPAGSNRDKASGCSEAFFHSR